MNQTELFRKIIHAGLTIVLLQGCSWTFVKEISSTQPASEAEYKVRVSECKDNVKYPIIDFTLTLIQIPILAFGGVLLSDKHESMNKIGGSIVATSGGLGTLFFLSGNDGREHLSRCQKMIKSSTIKLEAHANSTIKTTSRPKAAPANQP